MRPGSSIALGRAAVAPGSRGDRAWAARWPPTLAAGLSRAAGARTLCGSEGTGRRRSGRSGGAIPGAGLGCLLRVQPIEWRRSRRRVGGSSGSLHSASPTSMGRRAARERPSTGQRHIPKSKPQKPLPNSPCSAEMKRQRRKCLTMAENKGELHRDAACARPRRRTLSPPRPARLPARRRSPAAHWFLWPELETWQRDWCPASLSVSLRIEGTWVELGCRRERAAS